MSTTLTNGLKLPDKGSVDWYADMQNNYTILDGAVGTVAEHTSQIAGKAPLVHTHTKSDVTDLLNSNFIPSANNAYDLGSASNQWNNLYAKNYYYNGTAWGLDKANVWSQSNQFNGSVYSKAQVRAFKLGGFPNDEFTVQPQNTFSSEIDFVDKNGTIQSYIVFQHRADATETHRMCFRVSRTQGDHYVSVNLNSNDELYPERNNAIDLGTSTNKWKTLNGINPGALSLPKTGSTANTDYTDVLGNITVIDPDTQQPYTDEQNFVAPATGWLVMWFSFNKVTSCMAWLNDNVRTCLSGTFTAGYPGITLPVIAGETVHLRINATQIAGARLYYCQGNV